MIQLSRVQATGAGLADADLGGWCRLLREASQWREVPASLHNPILEEAMSVLNEFRTDVHLNQIYRGRLEYERVRAAEIGELEDARAERDAAVAAAKAAAVARDEEREAREAAEAARQAAEAARQAAEAARQAAEAAGEAERAATERERAEKERMAARLRSMGIDPGAE